jgi:cytochrome bd ubiquinol oxidase subunit II
MIDLVLVWAAIIGFSVLMYVVMDGFDLGIGILFPFVRSPQRRDTMLNSIAPVWDGNETWLVMGGVGLYAVFPVAYSILLTAFYAPLIAMLLALVFRGVAFEFRFRDERHRRFWDGAFAGGSVVATFAQGVVLGAFIQGIPVDGRAYAGGWFDWLTPFSLFTGAALVAGYALLGAGWLVMKTGGDLQAGARWLMRPLAWIVIAAILAVSLWTPVLSDAIARRWFDWPNIAYLSPVPVLVALCAVMLDRAIVSGREALPFLLALGLFALSYLGLGISLFPQIVPPTIDVWQAASPPESLIFFLVGAAVLLPAILGYTAYAYWVFRGKTAGDAGYH